MQRYDKQTTGMHWQIGKGGGFHYYEAEQQERPLPVTVFIGGPPALILSAIAPLPEDVPESWWPFAPDLAIEVISPNDSYGEVDEKVREYLAAGTSMVIVINPPGNPTSNPAARQASGRFLSCINHPHVTGSEDA